MTDLRRPVQDDSQENQTGTSSWGPLSVGFAMGFVVAVFAALLQRDTPWFEQPKSAKDQSDKAIVRVPATTDKEPNP